MSVPIPPPDPYKEVPPLWRRLLVILLLAVWPAGALFLLLGSAAGEDSFLGRGFTALDGASLPWPGRRGGWQSGPRWPWLSPLCLPSPPA